MENKIKAGRPKFKPTSEQRKTVESMSGMGIPQEQICSIIGISDDTLRKYFDSEILTGQAKANTKIAQCLFNKATSGDTSALIFWAKTRLKWKETEKIEITGKDGGAIEVSNDSQLRLIQDVFKMGVKQKEDIEKIIKENIDKTK